MYNFILQLVIVLSLGIIVYLVARTMPRITSESEVIHSPRRFDKLISKIPLAKIDAALNAFLEKLLRKVKVFIMKVDNLVNIYINKLKKNGKPKEPLQ